MNRVLFIHKEECKYAISREMDGTGDYHVK
jgi:hypothetical protein